LTVGWSYYTLRIVMTGKEIRALRQQLGWTQVSLADAVGVTSNTVARWERGEMAISEPTVRLLKKIAAERQVMLKEG
jgi:transcriptional regulator with XRE-family HTH domain